LLESVTGNKAFIRYGKRHFTLNTVQPFYARNNPLDQLTA